MHLELIPLCRTFLRAFTQPGNAECVPESGTCLPPRTSLVGDGEVVDGLDMRCMADVLDRRDEALCTRVKEMLRLWTTVGLAPLSRFKKLLVRVASRLAEGDEPDREVRVGNPMEDAIELTAIMLPYEVVSHEVCFSDPV